MRDPAALVFPGHRFASDPPDKALRLAREGVGGFCFYGGTAQEVAGLAQRLRAAAKRPLILGVDYENGAGQWVARWTRFPANLAYGALGSAVAAREKGRRTAEQALALGLDWVYAPVVDLATRPENPIVNLRAFHADPAETARLARAYLRGLHEGGALDSVKHFPGHGDAAVDSHLALPTIRAARALLERRELPPFRALLGGADSVMVGHLKMPAVDAKLPASLSKKWIDGVLRRRLGYRGLIVTDALSMKALPQDRPTGIQALEAGADVLLVPAHPMRLIRALRRGEADPARVKDALRRLDAFAVKGAQRRRAARKVPFSAFPRRSDEAFAAACAQSAAAWIRAPMAPPRLREAALLEAEPGRRLARAFEAALKQAGVRLRRSAKGLPLIVATFCDPKAFSGKIDLSPAALKRVRAAMKGSGQVYFVDFGSPFAGRAFKSAFELALFGASDAAQEAAAQILAGTRAARGNDPALKP